MFVVPFYAEMLLENHPKYLEIRGNKRRGFTRARITKMFALLFDLEDYATTYRATRDAYLKAANELKLATGAL